MNIAASIISLLMTLLPFVLRLLLYINCIIPTKARNGCRLAPECVCVREREREQLSHPATSIHPCVGGMRLNPTFAPSQRERERWKGGPSKAGTNNDDRIFFQSVHLRLLFILIPPAMI